jgi:hypothetical protein
MRVRIQPEPTDEERQVILAALAAGGAEGSRNLPPPFVVEEACAVAVEIIPHALPTSRSARSA